MLFAPAIAWADPVVPGEGEAPVAEPDVDDSPLEPALLVAVATLALSLGIWAYVAKRRQGQDRSFNSFVRSHGFEAADEEALATVQIDLDRLFGEGAKVVQAHRAQGSGFDILLVWFRFPEYRADEDGEWNERVQESIERVILLVHGFEEELPYFRLLPNNWAVNLMRGHLVNTFGNVEPFGAFNFVVSQREDDVRRVLSHDIQQQLRRNRALSVESRGDFAAFYAHGDRRQPQRLDEFFQQAVAIAKSLRANAKRRAAE